MSFDDADQRGALALNGPRIASGIGALFGLLLVAWLLAYISGLFPYLGSREHSRSSASPFLAAHNGSMGTNAMLLFAGQTAFIDYEFEARGTGAVGLDIRPWPGIARSERYVELHADARGRLERQIETTGLYYFHVDETLSAYQEPMRYKASWGAR